MDFKLVVLAFAPALLFGQSAPAPAAGSDIVSLSTSEKFETRLVSAIGPYKLFIVGLEAGYNQVTNTPVEWHQGAEGFGKRYASQWGTTIARQMSAFGLEAALHEDPRYIPSGQKGFFARTGHALKSTLVTRTDSGRERFATARFASALGSSFLTNVWQPKSNSSAGDALTVFGFTMAGDAGFNFLQEFIPRFRPKEFRNR